MGTAHVSERSAEEVRETIREEDPDVVAVELDSARYERLMESERDGVYGADMRAAVEQAEEQDVPVALIDREITTTLKRLWTEMTVFERLKMAGAMVAGFFGVGAATVEELEEAIEEDSVEEHVDDLRQFSPGGARTLIDERDAFMARRLMELSEEGDVVAVVGAGHRSGIESYLESPEKIPEIPETARAGTTDADVFDADDEMLVVLDLPGCEEDDVNVVYEDGRLEVSAARDTALEPGFHRVSSGGSHGFEASVDVPGEVDAERASASLDDGVLEVRLPKQQ